ncbi:hypothetical protein NLJ89_g7654 [Agrocybe chaxingu]|uniref:BZIP domain-containing protein n=1 Tax=Agrocybe chaxingu TaxID=84603 RepID=A0A9W8K3Z9_9AGAR|nr:hypothetical protein NLJ89_g7654 [Agrocybe chaxingu]
MSERQRARSESGDIDDSDHESHAGDSNPPGKPGRKKNPNSQAARRDQNRIAQREFRLRKQQRIRDLEARVELLSGTQDEAVDEMRNVVKDLLAENHMLRGLLRSLASFIGEGVGGVLPKLGWDPTDFNTYMNRAETDTAWEGYQARRKKSAEAASMNNGPSPHLKRPTDDDSIGARAKKARNEKDSDSRNGFSLLVPMSSGSLPAPSLYPPSRGEQGGILSDLMRGPNNSTLFMQPSSGNGSSQYPAGPSNLDGYSRPYLPGVNVNMESGISASPYDSPGSGSGSQRPQHGDGATQEEVEEDDDPKKNEAYKLIHYHLENYKRNSSYCLPASLRPTMIQRTIPHESVVDRVLHPELRDRMILLRQRFELVDCLMDLRQSVTIHGDDVLAHSNWEIGESFIRKYSYLIDVPVLKITNRWRRERGQPELVVPEINGDSNAA